MLRYKSRDPQCREHAQNPGIRSRVNMIAGYLFIPDRDLGVFQRHREGLSGRWNDTHAEIGQIQVAGMGASDLGDQLGLAIVGDTVVKNILIRCGSKAIELPHTADYRLAL